MQLTSNQVIRPGIFKSLSDIFILNVLVLMICIIHSGLGTNILHIVAYISKHQKEYFTFIYSLDG